MLKKKALLIGAMALGVSALCGAIEQSSVPSQMAKLATKAPVMAISRLDDWAVAVGDRGHILSFSDSKWQQVPSPSDVLYTNISQLDQNHAWAVGHDLTIVATSDGGKSWQLQQYAPQSDRPLLDILFSDNQHGIAVGAYGTYFKTSDGGATWHKQFLASLLPQDDIDYLAEIRAESEAEYQYEISSILPHFNKLISLSDSRLLMVGELGLIAFSSDAGKTWSRSKNVYNGSFFSALETTKQTLLVAGLRGNVYRSVDQGQQWQQIKLSNTFSINDIRQHQNGDIYISQNNGVILKSTDDGQSFEFVGLYKGQDLLGIVNIDGNLWLGTSKGLQQHQVKK